MNWYYSLKFQLISQNLNHNDYNFEQKVQLIKIKKIQNFD